MAVVEAAQAALAEEQFSLIAKILDKAEIDSPNPNVLGPGWPHALHLLGHIYNQQLEDARFLWKRIPVDAKKGNPELEAVWRLLQYCWAQQYEGIWSALQGYAWTPQVRPLIAALMESWRARLLALTATAYSLVTTATLAALLGLSEAEAGSLAAAQGWRQDMESGAWVPAPPAEQGPGPDGIAQLQQLSSYVVHLESS